MGDEAIKSEVDEILDNPQTPTVIEPKQHKIRKSKIDLAGEQVVKHLFTLATTTDLSYAAMAKKINELYQLDINKQNVVHFFKTNANMLAIQAEEQKSLGEMRAKTYLEHNGQLTQDIKVLNSEIEKLIGEEGEIMEPDRRAKALGDLIDKKGKLLMRHAKLSGKITEGAKGDGVQVNIQINNEKSDIINRLKKAEFKKKAEGEIIDVVPSE
ncbi:MAG: hypothetical protein GY861_17465 [bacterium]|nr:hypothetical protein [bacterium]